jgi:hypothetical protein
MSTIRELLDLDLLELFGLKNAPAEEQEKFFDAASQAIFTRLVARIEETLSPEKKEEFYRLFETPASDEDKQTFFAQEIPDFEKILLEETLAFKEGALNAAREKTPS